MPGGSAVVRQKPLDTLDEAIEQERLAHKRYTFGPSLATDPAVKEMFLQLVEGEMGHERTLRGWQLALQEET
jgi:rubrerythrin